MAHGNPCASLQLELVLHEHVASENCPLVSDIGDPALLPGYPSLDNSQCFHSTASLGCPSFLLSLKTEKDE